MAAMTYILESGERVQGLHRAIKKAASVCPPYNVQTLAGQAVLYKGVLNHRWHLYLQSIRPYLEARGVMFPDVPEPATYPQQWRVGVRLRDTETTAVFVVDVTCNKDTPAKVVRRLLQNPMRWDIEGQTRTI